MLLIHGRILDNGLPLYLSRISRFGESKIGYRQLLRHISEYFKVLSRKILAKPHSYTYWFVNCYWS